MINRIILNETSYFGPGSIRCIVDEVKKRGFKKALVGSALLILRMANYGVGRRSVARQLLMPTRRSLLTMC